LLVPRCGEPAIPYNRPTLTALRDQGLQDVNAARIQDAFGNILDGMLPKAIVRVLVYAIAGQSYENYAYLDWISKQSIPATATGEFLAAWGGLKGVTRNPAIAATGSAIFVAGQDAAAPAVIPVGARVVRTDGVAYTTTSSANINPGGQASVSVVAATLGSDGNAAAGVGMMLADPIVGVQTVGSAGTPLLGGVDQETDEAFRTRILQVYSLPPQGGSRNDYLEWALAVPGVTRAWINPTGGGVGTVLLYVMFDQSEAAHNGFPQGTDGVATAEPRGPTAAGDQLAVANAILPKQPVTALVYALSPIASPVNFSIAGLGTSNTPAMQAAISGALSDMFLRLANVGGTVQPATGYAWPPIEPSAWYAALEAVPGLTAFTVTAPVAPLTPLPGNLFTLGTVGFAS
jgi:uncharacterized phage protein gp47/JayE